LVSDIAFVKVVLAGGEFAGVVSADEAGEPAEDDDEEVDWRREKGSFKLGSR
jgi:hypothetical protein